MNLTLILFPLEISAKALGRGFLALPLRSRHPPKRHGQQPPCCFQEMAFLVSFVWPCAVGVNRQGTSRNRRADRLGQCQGCAQPDPSAFGSASCARAKSKRPRAREDRSAGEGGL